MLNTRELIFTEPYEELMQYLDRACAMANFAIATQFDELDGAVIFGYFEALADILCQMKNILKGS